MSGKSGAKSGAPCADVPELPPALAGLVREWPQMGSEMQAAVLDLVRALQARRSPIIPKGRNRSKN